MIGVCMKKGQVTIFVLVGIVIVVGIIVVLIFIGNIDVDSPVDL